MGEIGSEQRRRKEGGRGDGRGLGLVGGIKGGDASQGLSEAESGERPRRGASCERSRRVAGDSDASCFRGRVRSRRTRSPVASSPFSPQRGMQPPSVRIMIARAFPHPSPLLSRRAIPYDSNRRRRFPEATANVPAGEPAPGPSAGRKRANLVAIRKERVKLLEYTDVDGRSFSIMEFLNHPSGVEALLNTRALQSFESLGANSYRCTLHKIRFLAFDVAPVLELRVLPTNEDCTVEMLACKFEGSESIKKQNNLFSAFMRNHITWEVDCSDPYLEVDVNLSVSLEVYTKPFSLLPISAVEKPGNLVMQGLLDKLVPLLAEQLLKDYATWVEQQIQYFP